MSRLFFALGSVAVEIVTLGVDGLITGGMLAAGALASTVHLLLDSETYRKMIDRLSGFDLPEVLNDGSGDDASRSPLEVGE
jgi:hypothetical protein